MKTYFLSIFTFIGLHAFSDNSILLVEGKYQNKNIYVQNGFVDNGVGFCAFEVRVNGQVTTDEVNSSAFEVDLSPFKLNIGEKVTIEIHHKEGCVPKVLNPEVLRPKPTYEVNTININADAMLTWSTKNEIGSLPFIIEQYKWNKWVYVGEVNGQGTPQQHEYKFKLSPHSGENKYRVKQVGYGNIPRYSEAVTYNSLLEKPTYEIAKDSKSITFSSETFYEVYDVYGNVVKKGFSNTIDISNLSKGKYYLCYDSLVVEIEKKKS